MVERDRVDELYIEERQPLLQFRQRGRLAAGTPLSEWTRRSLRKLIQQLQEEIIRFESHTSDTLRR